VLVKAPTPIGLVLASLLGGCRSEAPPRSEADVQVAVLRQQVGYWLDDNGRESGLLVCLGVAAGSGVRGVDGAFLGSSTDRSLVRPAELCEERATGAVERATARPAITIVVSSVRWTGADEAIAEVRHFRDALVSGRRRYRIVRELSRWVCVGEISRVTPS
jgi:hypothetical protein